jgi:hypothetical protein
MAEFPDKVIPSLNLARFNEGHKKVLHLDARAAFLMQVLTPFLEASGNFFLPLYMKM